MGLRAALIYEKGMSMLQGKMSLIHTQGLRDSGETHRAEEWEQRRGGMTVIEESGVHWKPGALTEAVWRVRTLGLSSQPPCDLEVIFPLRSPLSHPWQTRCLPSAELAHKQPRRSVIVQQTWGEGYKGGEIAFQTEPPDKFQRTVAPSCLLHSPRIEQRDIDSITEQNV